MLQPSLDGFSTLVVEFVDSPTQDSFCALLKESKNFIISQALNWKHTSLSIDDKIRELMSEMFLILIEDFDSSKANTGVSILSYLKLRLKRIKYPKLFKHETSSEDLDLSLTGRTSITPLRHQFINEIFLSVRQTMLSVNLLEHRLLEFLFIHIYPEVAWASKMISQKFSFSPQQAIERDKKRHKKFNQALQKSFKNLKYGDWREIADWSRGERSHLAWRIIDIAPIEVSHESIEDLQKIEAWREEICTKDFQPTALLDTSINILNKMNLSYLGTAPTATLEEEIAEYDFEPLSCQDVLLHIFDWNQSCPTVAEKTGTYKTGLKTDCIDQVFDRVSAEVTEWFIPLLTFDNKSKDTK